MLHEEGALSRDEKWNQPTREADLDGSRTVLDDESDLKFSAINIAYQYV